MQVAHRIRGQALVETAVFLPTFIFILFAVIWSVQTAIVNERLQVAVRYSGLISSEINPYMEYSLYVIYNNEGSTIGVAPQQCFTPSPDALTNSGNYPGPASGSFFTPTTVAATCTGNQVSFTSSMIRTELVRTDAATISATSAVPTLFNQAQYGWQNSTTPLGAAQNFLKTPDLGTLMHCYPSLNSTVSASLSPPAASTSPIAIPTAIPGLGNTLPTGMSVAASCLGT